MMYKATLTFSLLFLAVVGSAQNDGGADTSAQPPSTFSLPTGSQVYPSGSVPTSTPTSSDGDSSQTNRTRPSGCYPHSAISTDQPLPSGVYSSAAYGASSNTSKPHFRCEPDSESTMIPTGTASVPPYSVGGALPSTNARPIHSMAPNGSNYGNSTLPTGSPEPFSSGAPGGQQEPPVSTATATTSYGKLDCLLNNHFIIVYSD